MSQQGGGNLTQELQPGQQSKMVDNPEERLVIVKMPRDQRPFTRDGVVDSLLRYGYHDFEAVGRFSRGLEFQVLLEKEVDADHMSSRGFLEVKNARGHPRYWGGTFIMCIIPRSEEEIAAIPDFQDVEVRGRRYSMLSVVLGLPPRCHRCKVRGHLAYQCVACRYCGSDSHTSEDHSVENARRREFSAVVEGLRGYGILRWRRGRWRREGRSRNSWWMCPSRGQSRSWSTTCRRRRGKGMGKRRLRRRSRVRGVRGVRGGRGWNEWGRGKGRGKGWKRGWGRDGDGVRGRGGRKRGKGGLGGSQGEEESEEKSSGQGRQ